MLVMIRERWTKCQEKNIPFQSSLKIVVYSSRQRRSYGKADGKKKSDGK
jgi:hypothetical protein